MQNLGHAQAFIEHLRLHGQPIDLMQLRRSVGSTWQPATIPLIEDFLNSSQCKDPWERQIHYLVAGLWATMLLLPRASGQPQEADSCRSLGHSTARLYLSSRPDRAVEYAFLDLLQADAKNMPHCLEMLMIRLEGQAAAPIYWPELLADLLDWNHKDKPVQQKWAGDFNRTLKEAKPSSRLQQVLRHDWFPAALIIFMFALLSLIIVTNPRN